VLPFFIFRLLKRFDLAESPAFQLVTAADRFAHPTRRVNELWQTDFTYFKIQGWGWYHLSTMLDDYSRYILAWKQTPTMAATDVQETLELALMRAWLETRPAFVIASGCFQTTGRAMCLGSCAASWKAYISATLAGRLTIR
jgi:hypothetical protein